MSEKRQSETIRSTPETTSYLSPKEIVSRLQMIVQDIGIDLQAFPRIALPEADWPDALDRLVNGMFLLPREHRGPTREAFSRLPNTLQQHLAFLLHSSLEAAQTLQASRPDIQLAFPRGPQGMLSNLLSASWVDLTLGGALDVRWDPVPEYKSKK